MILSFGELTLQATPEMNMGCVIEIGDVSTSVACFVHERAPTQGLSSVSLARRRPQSRLSGVCAAVHTNPSRVGRSRRGPTSKIPDRSLPGSALRLHALVVAARSHSARPNYAFERTGDVASRARVRPSQPFPPSARLRRRVPAAQRER